MPAYLAARRKFLPDRAAFPIEELAKYAGEWVAWIPDGTRVAASRPVRGFSTLFSKGRARTLPHALSKGFPMTTRPLAERTGTKGRGVARQPEHNEGKEIQAHGTL
jgi:hypothetical protein